MQGAIKIELDTREFDRALKLLAGETSKTFPELVNDQAFRLANEAMQQTKRADASKIESQLTAAAGEKVIGSQFARIIKRGKNKGQFKVYRKAKEISSGMERSFAARIINKKRRERGDNLLWGDALANAAKRMIGARKRAVAFGASGWLPAIRLLGAMTKRRAYMGGGGGARGRVRQVGTDKGGAISAKGAVWMKICEIWNKATENPSKSSGRPGKLPEYVLDGLRKAIPIRTAEMLDHYQKRLSGVWKKYSAR